jgi:flagellar biosynthesis chaperone FliJ
MKAFRFPLEQVRSWRHEQAELEELKLQKIHAELQSLVRLARQVQGEAEQAARSVLSGALVAADELASLDAFREFTRGRLKQIAEQTRQCQERAEQQQKRLIEARRQFELLDRFKKKALAEWRLARDKEQEELAAELFLAKRTRDRD